MIDLTALTTQTEPMAGSKQEIEAYESQAIGRAHRQGQKNKVTIVRFYTANTIEEDMHNRRKGIMKGTPEKLIEISRKVLTSENFFSCLIIKLTLPIFSAANPH
jgi:SNF2 family DNA or RNA helicase